MKSIPGDPFTSEQEMPKEILDSLYAHYGFDKPLYVQFFKYLKGIATFNLGPSYVYEGKMVGSIIKEAFPISAFIGLQAILIALIFGISLGVIAAIKQNKWVDRFILILSVSCVSIPSFLLATLLQYVLSIKLSLFPIARWGTYWHTVLPTLALAATPMAFILKMIRANLIDIYKMNFIKLAHAKGLSNMQILIKHALPNAILPVISYLGPITAYVLTGSFIIEKIFGIPGMGQWLIISIHNRDYTMIMGFTIFYSTVLMLSVFLVDLLYSWIDPRIQLKNETKNFEIPLP